MTLDQSDISELLEALRAGGGIDVVRRGVELVLQALIEAEGTAYIGVAPYGRVATRTNQRNGTRERLLSTKAGDVQLQIPKLRKGSSSRRCWSGDGASTGRCSRWRWRSTCTAFPPARWTTWCRR